jgi:hypothetical protein
VTGKQADNRPTKKTLTGQAENKEQRTKNKGQRTKDKGQRTKDKGQRR